MYAVEASNMALNAKKLIEANGYGSIIEVIHSTIEDISEELIPRGTIDVIVSEPLGSCLVHERMIETYVIARDRFLSPDGRMYPSSAHLCIQPFYDEYVYNDQVNKCAFWNNKNFHGIDMTHLYEKAVTEKLAQPIIDTYDPKKK